MIRFKLDDGQTVEITRAEAERVVLRIQQAMREQDEAEPKMRKAWATSAWVRSASSLESCVDRLSVASGVRRGMCRDFLEQEGF